MDSWFIKQKESLSEDLTMTAKSGFFLGCGMGLIQVFVVSSRINKADDMKIKNIQILN